MTHQTSQPLPDYRLQASNRTAREFATTLMPQLDMNPPYQRGHVWTNDQRVALVKSWIMGIPVPAVLLNDRATAGWRHEEGVDVYAHKGTPIWGVVDGKQRIQTAIQWFQNDLAVPASWLPPEWIADTEDTNDGPYVYYLGLTAPGQRLFANTATLPLIESKLPSIRDEADLYLLVNGGGTAQTDTDMDNARKIAQR